MFSLPTEKAIFTKPSALFFGDSLLHHLFLMSLFLFISTVHFEIESIEIDWSRLPAQQKSVTKSDSQLVEVFAKPKTRITHAVILNEKGFISAPISMTVDQVLDLNVVNIHTQFKAASVALDDFGILKGISYGELNQITLNPKQAGYYKMRCLETGAELTLVVEEKHEPKRKK